jgi:hypothetical protein
MPLGKEYELSLLTIGIRLVEAAETAALDEVLE